MSIKKYNDKRDFKTTTEPHGRIKKTSKKSKMFVVQKHAASHLHYDFRLEIDGVLKSWAIPKGPCLDPEIKRLAVHVEDHPLTYGNFEGIIPKGQYGGGTVMVWDTGTWEEIQEPKKGYSQGNLSFILKGKKLKGRWKLIQIKSDPENWLLMKADDNHARSITDYDITTKKPLSVLSKKSISEIKDNPKKAWRSSRTNAKKKASINNKKMKPIKIGKMLSSDKISRNTLPLKVFPELATLVDRPPNSNDWLHEIKFDGYRLIAHIDSKVKLITRGQLNWTKKFPNIQEALESLDLKDTIVDGEIVVLDSSGKSNFQLLQDAISSDEKSSFHYYIFDILYYRGYDLTEVELLKRKQILKQIMLQNDSPFLHYSDHVIGNGKEFFENACQLSLEGIISKEIHSAYVEKRTKSWLKVKCSHRQEFVIGGFTKPKGSRQYFGSLLLGTYSNDKLIYCGHVGTGFDSATLDTLHKMLIKQQTNDMPFKNKPKERNIASWVKPKIVIEVEFTEWTNEGMLRHPSFKGIRMDKASKQVKCEIKKNSESPKVKSSSANINLTHPDKIMYPKSKITKLELSEFYQKFSKWILPHLINRPLSLLRCPEGILKECFFQKHLNKNDNKQLELFESTVKKKNNTEKFFYIKNVKGLLKLVQMGVLEIHPWGSKADKPDKPDRIIFDLDPDINIKWSKIVDCALRIKKELEELGLKSFVKTTGGKGLHIVIPIQRRYNWDTVLNFSKVFVQYLVKKYPKEYIDTMSKAKRSGKIYIDYLRNHMGATAIGAYSTRARENAPIATPISWNELSAKMKSDYFTLRNLPDRLLKLKDDPWSDFFKLKQKLPSLNKANSFY